ncbi:MAG: Branched-chain amino acid transport system permease protein LivM [uncultured Thermomicrobiales bacterium]|uniref:Branched-chain amino acid transport system permease protein LivM n=1 Tax=uncultured Thermomicrobiales bacterium TaxID=1645740 RepID=A0A6J4UDH5_9BACT|nr:MAG: Branched-chain amino acid transport system permease protein LivM [uncultured Thermomicrobiales bacterium]
MAETLVAPARGRAPARTESEGGRLDARKLGLFVLCLAAVFAYPFVDQALGWGRVGSFMSIFVFVILAMGLNVVVGYAGLLDLGYAAFFAIGAYTMAFLTSPGSVFVIQGLVPPVLQNFWVALVLSWFTAAAFGVLLGAPTLRLRGDYLAIVTLGFGEIVPNFFYNADGITNGTRGINPIGKPPTIELFGLSLGFGPTDQRNWYWLILLVGLLSLFLITRLYASRLGRAWQAVREDEIAAASMGVNLVRTKLWAFALGASFSGFAGSVYASAFQYVHPSQFEFSISVMVLSMVILGGIGNIYGVIAGGLLLASFDRILAEAMRDPIQRLGEAVGWDALAGHDITQDRLLVFGLALVLMMLLRPGGLFPNAQRRAELTPEDEDITVAETQTLYDLRAENEPALGERA